MKSSTAAPSFRNSGIRHDGERDVDAARPRARRAIASRTRSAVPTGTVDLSTTILNSVIRRPMLRAAASTYFMSAEPSSSGRRAHGDELERAVRDGGVLVGREVQAARGDVALDHRLEAGLVNGHAAARQDLDLERVDVEAQHVVADFGKAGPRDEPDIARPDHRDLHAATSSEALMAASAATGSRRLDDRTPDHEIVGAIGDRRLRRDDPRLVVGGAAGGPDARE